MFKKSTVIGVSVSPEVGLEVAQIDYSSGTVLKYGRKPVDYSAVKREIADLDLFKESLQDLLEELEIPKGSELVLSLPTVTFKVTDFPSALEPVQVESAIEEDLYENPYLQNYEPCYSYSLVNSTLQFNKYAYTAVQKQTVIELILSIKDMGYKVSAIDTSVDAALKSLIYLDRINSEPDTNWVLLTVDNGCCRISSMLGKKYIDAFEEKISIGEVLSDAENYATVISAIEPILKNLPSKYLCVVSKTNIISAEVLANKISYSAPIIYQEANTFLKEPLLNISSLVDEKYATGISLDVIGAAIYNDYKQNTTVLFNLFNKTLGDIYFMEQPPTIMNGKIVLSNGLLIFAGSIILAVIVLLIILISGFFIVQNTKMNSEISQTESEIQKIDLFLEKNKGISAETFDEGDEIKLGLQHNKNIYSYYTIVGTEIPQKLWLTHLNLGNKTTIEGQADNIESIYAFYRNIKDYNPSSDISLQELGLATASNRGLNDDDLDAESILTSLDADFYKFRISNDTAQPAAKDDDNSNNNKNENNGINTTKSKKNSKKAPKQDLPNLEIINQ